MPYPSYQNKPSRLMPVIPKWGSPYTSGQAMQIANPPPGPGMPPRSPQIPIPAPTPSPIPSGSGQQYSSQVPRPAVRPEPKPEITPYMETIYKSIQNVDPEMREEYLSTTMASIKDRLDRYEFRLARGIPLTAEQQRQYDSIRGAYNDIQKYINNPQPYDEIFAQQAANIEQARIRQDPDYMRKMGAWNASQRPSNYGGGTFL